jgi:hypothetical protein
MSTTNLFMTAASFQPRQETIEHGGSVQTGKLTANLRNKIESERRILRLSRQGASPKFDGIELIVFRFFWVLASVTAVYSGTELLQLLHSGALEQTVTVLLKR